MNERYSYRLIRDLFAHKDAIFGELKRASTLTHSSSGSQRPRAISTDESNRRANYEERNRAIAAQRSPRATSPGPGARNGTHRRDRSQTRFPVNTTSPTERRGTGPARNSLEVPVNADGSAVVATDIGTNGTVDSPVEQPTPSATRVPLPRKHAGSLARGNRDSMGSLKGESNRDSVGSLKYEDGAAAAPRGVQLEDKPMDD
jgi:hypothetical protein